MALNCGFTQIDICTLEHRHIEERTGCTLIKRKRNKTKTPQSHELWPETAKLLKLEATPARESELMLLNRNGNPLTETKIKANGHVQINDTIRLAFDRAKKQAGFANHRRTFSTLRKSGANELAKAYDTSPLIVDLYLAHANQATSKHYVRSHYGTYFEALKYLGRYYDLATAEDDKTSDAA